MEEKNKFLDDVVEKSRDEAILTNIKFEDSLDYRFDLVEEDALQRGMEQKTNETIIAMAKNNATLEFISKVTNKSIKEIKEIIDSNKE